MKKLAATISGITYFLSSSIAFAVDEQLNIARPMLNGKNVGYTSINDFINKVIILIFIIATLAVLVMLIWGAVEWIFSGGNKDAVGNARNRIIHALVGFAILAVAFALASLAGQFLGIDILGNFTIPTPGS